GADFAWRQFYPEHARIIQIDIDPMHLGRRHPVDVGVAADVKDTLTALLPRLDIRDASHFYRKAVEDYRRHVGKTAKAAVPHRDGSIPPRYLMEVLDKAIADDALVAADDGTPVCFMVRQMRGTGERRFFSSLLHGTMASAMPTAIGLKKAVPHRQVVALCGDGGLAMLFGDLMTLIQEKLPIKLVVFNNSKLGFVALEQKSEGLRELYTDLVNPDFGKVAAAMGLWGRKVTEAGDLEAAVSAWLAEPGPALLDVAIDPMTLIMPPTIEFGPAYGMALYSAKAILHGEGRDVWEMVKDNVF
ncbi:MAG: thiamine pyrophosphate-dependent enzyme, partial [Janthinobacterium lividum]